MANRQNRRLNRPNRIENNKKYDGKQPPTSMLPVGQKGDPLSGQTRAIGYQCNLGDEGKHFAKTQTTRLARKVGKIFTKNETNWHELDRLNPLEDPTPDPAADYRKYRLAVEEAECCESEWEPDVKTSVHILQLENQFAGQGFEPYLKHVKEMVSWTIYNGKSPWLDILEAHNNHERTHAFAR